MSDVNFIIQLLEKVSNHKDLLKCKNVLDDLVSKACATRDYEVKSKDPKDFISYNPDFLTKDSATYQAVTAELETLGLKCKSNTSVTKWLTLLGKEYSWSSSNGHITIKDPVDLTLCPSIHGLMKDINAVHGLDLNSCLACYYDTGAVYSSFHDDNEQALDPASPIVIVSLGVERNVQFVHQVRSDYSKPLYSIRPADGSLYTMKPGCQEFFFHQVKKDLRIKKSRFCLSFRRMLPDEEEKAIPAQPSSPVKELIEQFTKGQLPFPARASQTTSDIKVTPPAPKQPQTSRFKKKRTTVLLGTSITSRIKSSQIPERGRKFINLSKSGAKIRDIGHNLRAFYELDKAADDVEKIILSFGTNDIKYSRRGVYHLKRYIVRVFDDAKLLFPDAMIIVQCCLPIRNIYGYIVQNVLNFNQMLSQLCSQYNCVYVDSCTCREVGRAGLVTGTSVARAENASTTLVT